MADYGPYIGEVDSVHDGDTINIVLDVGFDLAIHTRVRVFGINAPELSTPAGKAARDFAKTVLTPGKPVKVLSKGWDKFGGRIDGVITYDGKDFAQTMLDTGHAKQWDGAGVKPT
ncbi:MAG TPA: thermonuclease family protein [Myxococcaceae bacterium]|nr:thermonuclease family protein [Myxococcaceae bacterium]